MQSVCEKRRVDSAFYNSLPIMQVPEGVIPVARPFMMKNIRNVEEDVSHGENLVEIFQILSGDQSSQNHHTFLDQ